MQTTKWIVAAVLVAAAGCGEPTEETIPDPRSESRMIVESHLFELDEVIVDAARQRAVREALVEQVQEEADREFRRRVDDGLRYAMVLVDVYDDEDTYGGWFVDQHGLTDRGQRLVEVLADADRHALEPETLHRERIDELRDELQQRNDTDRGDEFAFQPAEVEALVEYLEDAAEYDAGHTGGELLVDTVSRVDDEDTPAELERFAEYSRQEASDYATTADIIAELELRLVDGALRYAREMRHHNLERVDAQRLREEGSTDIILERIESTLQALLEAQPDEIKEVFRALEPSHPQYRALLEATDDYREFVEEGGWQEVDSFQVREGVSLDRVEQLRDRLEAEGYTARPEDPHDEFDPRTVDDTLIDGIREYQETHQFNVDGQPTPGFWRSINISAEDRLAQMELTLQRWRESYLEDDDDYVLVNIPGFIAQVWDEGEKELEFRVVVGNSQRRCDRDTAQWEYPDATPVMTAEMDHMIFNPHWYVPQRIVEETLEPRVQENEDYYEEGGYEEVELANGREIIRQNPGPGNALGLVKFMFPNHHSVYMHDTPDKQYFDFPTRAFSHGCIRVSEPMEFAEFLLEREERDDVDIEEVVDVPDESLRRPRRISFEDELPVFVEYYTVWVDDEGRPNFLADIYDRDAWRLSDNPDEFFDCFPPVHAPADEDDDDHEEDAPEDDEPGDEDSDDEAPAGEEEASDEEIGDDDVGDFDADGQDEEQPESIELDEGLIGP